MSDYKEMTYDEAKKVKNDLEAINQLHSKKLKSFDESHGGANSIGLVPDQVRELAERKELKNKYDHSFLELQKFNQWFLKTFKKEYREERKNRYRTN